MQTKLPSLCDEFQTALLNQDLGEAAKTALAIHTKEPAPSALLADLEQTIHNDEFVTGQTILHALGRRYQSVTIDERIAVSRAISAKNTLYPKLEPALWLNEFVAQHSKVALYRLRLFAVATVYLRVPEFRTPQYRRSTLAAIKNLQQEEQQIHNLLKEATSAISSVSLPPQIALLRTTPAVPYLRPGEQTLIEVLIGNIGDKTATGVRIDLTVPDELSASLASQHTSEIDAQTNQNWKISVTGSQVGTYELEVALTSDNGGEEISKITIEVTENPKTLLAAIDRDDSGFIETDEVQRAIKYWLTDTQLPELGGKIPNREELRRLILLWANHQHISQ